MDSAHMYQVLAPLCDPKAADDIVAEEEAFANIEEVHRSRPMEPTPTIDKKL